MNAQTGLLDQSEGEKKKPSLLAAATYGSIGGIATAAITAIAGLAAGKANALDILYGSLPGMFIGAAYEYIRFFHEITEDISSKTLRIQRLANDLSAIQVVSEFVQQRDKLVCHDRFHGQVLALVRKSAVERIHLMSSVSKEEFYDQLIHALEVSQRWDGIHQGNPNLLGLNAIEQRQEDALRYFEALRQLRQRHKDSRLRRIIILSADMERKFTLNEEGVYRRFWELNGGVVDNYLLGEERARDLLEGESIEIADLDDCALHDEVFFLHYDRKRHTMVFDCKASPEARFEMRIARAVHHLFDRLDKGTGGFSLLTEKGPISYP